MAPIAIGLSIPPVHHDDILTCRWSRVRSCRCERVVSDTEFPLLRCARTRPLPAGFVFRATTMIVDADR